MATIRAWIKRLSRATAAESKTQRNTCPTAKEVRQAGIW